MGQVLVTLSVKYANTHCSCDWVLVSSNSMCNSCLIRTYNNCVDFTNQLLRHLYYCKIRLSNDTQDGILSGFHTQTLSLSAKDQGMCGQLITNLWPVIDKSLKSVQLLLGALTINSLVWPPEVPPGPEWRKTHAASVVPTPN